MESDTLEFIVILFILALALLFSIIALLKSQKALKKSRGKRIETIAKREIENFMLLNYNQMIRNSVYEEFIRQQKKQGSNKEETSKHIEAIGNFSEDKEKPKDVTYAQGSYFEEKPVYDSLHDPVVLYTGVCKDGAFKHVTKVPDSKTVYTIYASSQDAVQGTLNVDESAFDKIAQTPEYLQNACRYSGNGAQLQVIKTGIVVKENGAWIVKDPILAEFK